MKHSPLKDFKLHGDDIGANRIGEQSHQFLQCKKHYTSQYTKCKFVVSISGHGYDRLVLGVVKLEWECGRDCFTVGFSAREGIFKDIGSFTEEIIDGGSLDKDKDTFSQDE